MHGFEQKFYNSVTFNFTLQPNPGVAGGHQGTHSTHMGFTCFETHLCASPHGWLLGVHTPRDHSLVLRAPASEACDGQTLQSWGLQAIERVSFVAGSLANIQHLILQQGSSKKILCSKYLFMFWKNDVVLKLEIYQHVYRESVCDVCTEGESMHKSAHENPYKERHRSWPAMCLHVWAH